MNAILGSKIGQTQTFDDAGKRIPVTMIQAGPCWVTQITDKHVQMGFGTIKNISKAEIGHIKKAGLDKKLRFLRSFPTDEQDLKVGTEVKVGEVLSVGDKVTITGVSKGKGFAGVVKRHGFMGGPRTHGQSDRERAPGSIGQTTTPGRVYRGKRMAGRMGNDQVTLRKLRVVAVDSDKNLLTLKGLVPGGVNGLLLITKE
jgi:large subunit ribosomal protein L3